MFMKVDEGFSSTMSCSSGKAFRRFMMPQGNPGQEVETFAISAQTYAEVFWVETALPLVLAIVFMRVQRIMPERSYLDQHLYYIIRLVVRIPSDFTYVLTSRSRVHH